MTTTAGKFSTSEDRNRALAGRVKVDPAVQRRAALYVAGQARDAADCRELLTALGLIGPPVRSVEQVRAQRARGGVAPTAVDLDAGGCGS